jgi:hypothetical protein
VKWGDLGLEISRSGELFLWRRANKKAGTWPIVLWWAFVCFARSLPDGLCTVECRRKKDTNGESGADIGFEQRRSLAGTSTAMDFENDATNFEMHEPAVASRWGEPTVPTAPAHTTLGADRPHDDASGWLVKFRQGQAKLSKPC